MAYLYGEEIAYKIDFLYADDLDEIREFSCDNVRLDYFFHNEIIHNEEVYTDDGLPFKVINTETKEIIAIFSLAASGIIHRVGTYSHILPAIKIDVFAVHKNYQKLHWDRESEESLDPNEHVYFSDNVMVEVIKHCRIISDTMAHASYIVLYADKKARRFYERNLFNDFTEFMEKENNMEIQENDPMYLELD